MLKATRTIRQKQFVRAKPGDVYDVFLDAKKHAAFTGSRATCNARVGGRFTAWDGYIIGRNLRLERGKRIVQQWKTTEWPKSYPSSILELSFRRVKGGTQLTMVHSKVPVDQASSYRQGWIDSYWKPLKRYFKEINERERVRD
jgi:activator of HSP90 ATPase